ncbi:uncharacterized protein LOC134209448 [Armigeres subalbatus]|uniref:uncharacterized protein LOC134209448 n=1 Tax=Armigeres subalbatus TaxID=124917 RepID=UPI002ED0EED0
MHISMQHKYPLVTACVTACETIFDARYQTPTPPIPGAPHSLSDVEYVVGRQPEICLRCSGLHGISEGEQCENPPCCIQCKADHPTTSRECPKYKQEEQIVRLKVDKGISFAEARRIFLENTRQETYAGVVQEHIQKQLTEKDQTIATLQKQIAALRKDLADLKQILKSRPQSQSPSPRNPPTTSDIRNLSTSTAKHPKVPEHGDRIPRKEQPFTSPPSKRRDNRKFDKQDYDVNTRSRSGKRQMEISPIENNNYRGKRISTPNTNSTTSNNDKNNGQEAL